MKPQLGLQDKPMVQSQLLHTTIMCELKPVYGQQLIPLYERLSRPDLSELCKDMHTTNPNESPKHLPTSLQILETVVTMSVLEFNYGQ